MTQPQEAGSAAFTDIEEDPSVPYPAPDLTEDEVSVEDLTDEDEDDGHVDIEAPGVDELDGGEI